MARIDSFFRRAAREGLRSAQVTYRGKRYQFDASIKVAAARKRRGMIAFLLAVGLLLAGLAFWQFRRDNKLPMNDSGEMLRLIVEEGKPKMLADYLRRHEYRDIADEYGWTPLHWAAFTGNREMMDLLRRHGASEAAVSTMDWFVFPKGMRPMDLFRRKASSGN